MTENPRDITQKIINKELICINFKDNKRTHEFWFGKIRTYCKTHKHYFLYSYDYDEYDGKHENCKLTAFSLKNLHKQIKSILSLHDNIKFSINLNIVIILTIYEDADKNQICNIKSNLI
ncbi:MAG: hypothetical protein M1576_04155 [Deltaproteobacteria bacterium]|nr:hypothetical protein [Deltaproteobacteria bacterium]